jgi:hypothetical protein
VIVPSIVGLAAIAPPAIPAIITPAATPANNLNAFKDLTVILLLLSLSFMLSFHFFAISRIGIKEGTR